MIMSLMEGDENTTTTTAATIPQMAAAAPAAAVEPLILPVSEAVEVAVGVDEKMNCVVGDDAGNGGMTVSASCGDGETSGKRKRGRPRKQPPSMEVRQEFVGTPESSAAPQKRGRGRPKGTGKWQTLAASFGGSAIDSAGSNFTPHAIAIQTGENIVQRICSFSQRASESICILSASGTVSSAEILRPGSHGGVLRYEGRFEIVSLTGSHANNGNGGVHGKICLLSVQLANPDGGLFGGAVAGSLIAGGPTQLVIATFRQRTREQLKLRQNIEPSEPNRVAVGSAPLNQMANGKLPVDGQVNGLANHIPLVSAPPTGYGIDNNNNNNNNNNNINNNNNNKAINEAEMAYVPNQSFDWTSLQSSSVHMSQHVISDMNTGVSDQ